MCIIPKATLLCFKVRGIEISNRGLSDVSNVNFRRIESSLALRLTRGAFVVSLECQDAVERLSRIKTLIPKKFLGSDLGFK